MNAALALQRAMKQALVANPALTTLLGGAHVYDEVPRGEPPSHVSFTTIETRDWSTADAKAHEHFVTLEIATNARSRALAQSLCDAVEQTLDMATGAPTLTLEGHRLVNLRLVFWTVGKTKSSGNFGATLRFRAATEPL